MMMINREKFIDDYGHSVDVLFDRVDGHEDTITQLQAELDRIKPAAQAVVNRHIEDRQMKGVQSFIRLEATIDNLAAALTPLEENDE
jgi:hypothetical protein